MYLYILYKVYDKVYGGINIALLFPDDVSSARRPVIVSPPSQYNSLTLVLSVIKIQMQIHKEIQIKYKYIYLQRKLQMYTARRLVIDNVSEFVKKEEVK